MAAPTAAALAAWIAWVAGLTGLPPAPPPQIVMTGFAPAGIHLVRRAVRGGDGYGAITLPGVVYLPRDWAESDPIDDCVLAHELTHVLQFASGRPYSCTGAMEPLAYSVQMYCLARLGVDSWSTMGKAVIHMAEGSACG